MKIKSKITFQYALNFIINAVIGWLIVSSLQSILPVQLTHANIPEMPPQLLADGILVISLALLMTFFNWVLALSFNLDLERSNNHHHILKMANWGWLAVTIISFIAIASVVNDGVLSNFAEHLTLISTIGNVILAGVNFGTTLRTNRLACYRWGLCFQTLLLITFWLNLWISPV
ncbi:hypothetical protein ACYATO_08130 [Lactobacillaceae bacterium Melli_B3]